MAFRVVGIVFSLTPHDNPWRYIQIETVSFMATEDLNPDFPVPRSTSTQLCHCGTHSVCHQSLVSPQLVLHNLSMSFI